MNKTIFVLLDGCGYDVATDNLGYPEHLVEAGQGAKYRIQGELPSVSRPMYETLLTGLPVYMHGVTHNQTVRRSRCPNLFGLCRQNGLKTAAAAYYWMSELYVKAPFDKTADRIQLESDGLIQHGMYYYADHYPDSHLFADAEFLRRRYDPDFLLIHSMNIDDAGHKFTSASREYAGAVGTANALLSEYLPEWIAEGYHVLVTADHGMNENGSHGGNSPLQREVPLYFFAPNAVTGNYTEQALCELLIAPLLCACLHLPTAPNMQPLPVKFFR